MPPSISIPKRSKDHYYYKVIKSFDRVVRRRRAAASRDLKLAIAIYIELIIKLFVTSYQDIKASRHAN